MKATKYLTIVLAVIAIVATIAWFLRNTLIQRIANPILKDYDVEVVGVSLDALATRDARISYLELVHDKGTTIMIEGLMLPVGTPENRFKSYSAEKVSIVTSSRDDGAPFEMARLIDQFLSLPDILAGSEIYIAEFNLAPYPTVRDLSWTLSDFEQDLSGTVESVELTATTTGLNATTHHVTLSLPNQSADISAENVISGELKQAGQSIFISGDSILDLPGWETVTKLAGIVPDAVKFRSGTAELLFEIEIPYDTTQSPSVMAALTPTSPLRLDYIGTSGESTDVFVTNSSAVEITATFPKVEWTLQQAEASLIVNYGNWNDIPVFVSGLSCESGPSCSMNSLITMNDAELPFGTVQQLELSTTENVVFPAEGVRVQVLPDATIDINGLSMPTAKAGHITAQLVSSATLELTDAGWQITADSLDANVETLSLTDGVSVTMPLFLENILISEHDELLAAESGVFAPSSQVELPELTVALPGFGGKVSWQGADAAADLTTVGLFQDGALKAQHNLDTGAGQLSIAEAAVSLSARKLSDRVSPWRKDWDLSAGTVAVSLQADWQPFRAVTKISGQSSARIEDLSGYYSETVFAGLSTSIVSSYDSVAGIAFDPTTISVALIEMGLPIEDLTADVTLDAEALAVEVENLSMLAFGGSITAEPFSFHTGRDVNNLTLHAESIELSELLTLEEFAAIEVSGSVGAELPITIATDGITIVDGTLTGEPPGGVIRYHADSDPGELDTSTIGLVTRALSNFEYDSLTSEVNYSLNGDLKLQMRLAGRNPEMEDSRPVVLNLGVENNVPQMLKSLQAARAVEEILEKRLLE